MDWPLRCNTIPISAFQDPFRNEQQPDRYSPTRRKNNFDPFSDWNPTERDGCDTAQSPAGWN